MIPWRDLGILLRGKGEFPDEDEVVAAVSKRLVKS